MKKGVAALLSASDIDEIFLVCSVQMMAMKADGLSSKEITKLLGEEVRKVLVELSTTDYAD